MKRIHNKNVKLHSCDKCDRAFESPGTLKSHKEGTHEKERFECQNCGSRLYNTSKLKAHMKNDCGRTFKCSECDHESATKRLLKSPMSDKHEGIKFPCILCDYKTARKGNMKIHMQALHENVVHNCQLCDYKTSTERNLRLHNKSKHIATSMTQKH